MKFVTLHRVYTSKVIGEDPTIVGIDVRISDIQAIEEPDPLSKRYGINCIVVYGDLNRTTIWVQEPCEVVREVAEKN